MSLRIVLVMLMSSISWDVAAQASAIYWIASDSSNWNNGANWSTTSGGTACNCVPSATNIVMFNGGTDGSKDGVCGLDVSSVSVIRFVFSDAYDGKLSLNGNDVNTTGQSTFTNATIVDYVGTSDIQFTGGGFTATANTVIDAKSMTITNGTGTTIQSTTISCDESITMTITLNNFTISNSSVITTPILTVTTINLFLNGGTFNGGTHSFVKTSGGSATNNSTGGNTFNAATTKITTMNTSSDLYLATSSGDDFNGDVYFGCYQNNSSIALAYGANSTFSGDITTSSSQQTLYSVDGVTFGFNTGYAILDGTSDQEITVTNETFPSTTNIKAPIFGNVRINKTTGSVILSTSSAANARPVVVVSKNLDLQSGVIDVPASSSVLLQINDNATVTGASNTSHVEGRVYKVGDDAFDFPVGYGGYYRSLSMSVPSSSSTFYAEYVSGDPGNTSTRETGIASVSGEEYWIVDRTAGTGSTSLTLSWNESAVPSGSSYIDEPNDLVVVYWSGSQWTNLGATNIVNNVSSGTLTSATAVSSFTGKKFTLGSTTHTNTLPITLISFAGSRQEGGVLLEWRVASEIRNDRYIVEHSSDGVAFTELEIVPGRGTTHEPLLYSYFHEAYLTSRIYYRLKQVDYDNTVAILGVCAILPDDDDKSLLAWPTRVRRGGVLHLSRTASGVIFDQSATPVFHFDNAQWIDVSRFSAGMYFIRDILNQTVRFIVAGDMN